MICFPSTFRGHLARQRLLLNELDVDVFQPTKQGDSIESYALSCAREFENYLDNKSIDAVLIRGDRFELLPFAMIAAYREIPIIHLEGGDLSGVIDNKIRYAITHLADYHFCTNDDAHKRLIQNGVDPNSVWNFGSLDVEYALSVLNKRVRDGEYGVVLYHPIPGEDVDAVQKATEGFVVVGSNSDYGKRYGSEEYAPDDFVNLLRYANVCVGNSSALIKEASVLGVPVVLIGDRQKNRLIPNNVLNVSCETDIIKKAIEFQSSRMFEPDYTYYKPNTAKNIAVKVKEILNE